MGDGLRGYIPRILDQVVQQAMRLAAGALGVRLLGPAPAPLALVAGRRRFHCLLKSPDWPSVRRVFAAGREVLGRASPVRLTLDLDPVGVLRLEEELSHARPLSGSAGRRSAGR